MSTADRFLSQSGNLADLSVASISAAPLGHAFDDLLDGLKRVVDVAHAQLSFDPRVGAWFTSDPTDVVAVPDSGGPDLTVICRQVMQTGRPIEIADLAASDDADARVVVDAGFRFYSGVPLLADSGRTIGALCVLDTHPRSFDDRQRAILASTARQAGIQLELRRALESALRANRYRTRLNVLATRSFRAPLTTIVTVLEELAHFSHSSDEKELVALALDAAHTLETDFRQVSEATAYEADQDIQPHEPVPLSRVFTDLAHTMAAPLRTANVRLEIEETPVIVDTNASLLLRSLVSLVRVALERQARLVCVQVSRQDGDLAIDVRARGGGDRSGMSERDAVGTREDLAGLNPNGSLGLGASIAKRSCDVLGYRLTMDTDLDIGSDYTIRIPGGRIT